MSLERRAGKGPGFGVSYTLAKAIRDVEGFLFLAQDQLNPAAEKSLASNNRTHQVVGRMNWLVPGGVQLAGIVQYRSGSPWNVTTGRDSNGDTEQNDRPDLVNPNGDRYDRNTYYGDFTGRVGNLGRNANIGPSFVTLDVRVSKVFDVQGLRFEGFVEAFNATNKVNFAKSQREPAVGAVRDLDVDSREPAAGRARLADRFLSYGSRDRGSGSFLIPDSLSFVPLQFLTKYFKVAARRRTDEA